MRSYQELKRKISNENVVDIGVVLNQSINLFKKAWAQGLVMLIFMLIFIFVLQFILFAPISIFASASSFFDGTIIQGMSTLMVVFLFFYLFFVMSFFFTIIFGLIGGLYIVYKKADFNEVYSISDFFILLSRDKIVKTFALSVLQVFITIVFMLMCYFPLIYAAVPISFFTVIYAFNQELSAIEIVKLSFAIGNKNWLQTFLLRLVTGIISLIGIFLCGFGIFITFFLTLIPQYFIYKQIIGFNNENEINSIGVNDEVKVD